MRKRIVLGSCLLLAAACLPAQVTATDRTVTVTVSRTPNTAPDQVTFTLSVYTPVDSTVDDVVAAVSAAGITAANFTSVSSFSDPSTLSNAAQLRWNFTLTVPLSNLKSTIDRLSALRAAFAKSRTPMSVSYALSGTQASPQAQSALGCAAADLVSDARAQAQKMASSAGATVGPVVAVSGSSLAIPAPSPFSSAIYLPSCSLAVTFALDGNTAPRTIAIASSRNVAVAPDQLLYTISVRTPLSGSVSDAVALLPGLGITPVNLIGVNDTGGPGNAAAAVWTFQLITPFARMKDLNTQLSGPPQRTGARPVTFSLSSQTSAAAASQACSLMALVNDAHHAADLIASAAGVNVGAVVGLSELGSSPTLALRQGNFAASAIYDPATGTGSNVAQLVGFLNATPPPPVCGMVVHFQVLR